MTSKNDDFEDHLSTLLVKVSHTIEEIRTRALKNILSKLNHGIITEDDLVDRQFLVHLLRWFNFKSCPMQYDVLVLLNKLVKYTSAAVILIDHGAVKFFSDLRLDLAPDLHILVDEIISSLLSFPNENVAEVSKDTYNNNNLHLCTNSKETICHEDKNVSLSQNCVEFTYPKTSSTGFLDESGLYYFDSTCQKRADLCEGNGITQLFELITFPYLPLSSSDLHVISSSNNSLKSSDSDVILQSCKFLCDVIFKDFPPEVFLQEPDIINSLKNILRSEHSSNHQVVIAALKCISVLTCLLHDRLLFYQDASFYCNKSGIDSNFGQLTNSLNNQPTLHQDLNTCVKTNDQRLSGDGQELSPELSANLILPQNTLNPEQYQMQERFRLNSSQALLTIPSYCLSVILSALPFFNNHSLHITGSVCNLVEGASNLLKLVIKPFVNTSVINNSEYTNFKTEFCHCLETCAELMNRHEEQYMSATSGIGQVEKHRTIFLAITKSLCNLLKLFPGITETSPLFTNTVVKLIMDESYRVLNKCDHGEFLNFLKLRNHPGFHVPRNRGSQDEYKSLCHFLEGLKSWERNKAEHLSHLAQEAVFCQTYIQNTEFITGVIFHCSRCFESVDDENAICAKTSIKVLLNLLAHPHHEIRFVTYSKCEEEVKQILNNCIKEKQLSLMGKRVRFILDSKVLFQLCNYGMMDEENISVKTSKILKCLLHTQAMSVELWKYILKSIIPVLPLLQSFTDMDTFLGRCIFHMIDPNFQDGLSSVCFLEVIRSNLRLMFHPNLRVRSELPPRIADILSHEPESSRKRPFVLKSALSKPQLSSLLLVDNPSDLNNDRKGSDAPFQWDTLHKLMEIVKNQKLDGAIKQSAFQQLALVLENSNLHEDFVNDSGIQLVFDIMECVLCSETEEGGFTIDVLPSCVSVLRCTALSDNILRHRLAYNEHLYYLVLKSLLLHQEDKKTRKISAELLSLLLFDEVSCLSSFGESLSKFSLPAVVVKRYHLPFTVPIHNSKSPFAVVITSVQSDLLQSEVVAKRLKVCWNLCWQGGIQNVLKSSEKNIRSDDQLDFTAHEVECLKYTDSLFAISFFLNEISNATTHNKVRRLLHALKLHTVFSQLEDDSYDLISGWDRSFDRFFKVIPSSEEDKKLFVDILDFCSWFLTLPHVPVKLHQWLWKQVRRVEGPIQQLLNRLSEFVSVEEGSTPKQLVQEILKLVCRLLVVASRGKLDIEVYDRDCLVSHLIQGLMVAGTPQFYSLPVLEKMLVTLLHVTGKHFWSREFEEKKKLQLTRQLLTVLMDVVIAFHFGSGGNTTSFMGRGIVKAASMCLHQLADEMTSQMDNWEIYWLHEENTGNIRRLGLMWLLPLWTDRDPEVRTAGLGIASCLTVSLRGCHLLGEQLRQVSGGIWGAALSFLLDHREASSVREQAALILCNLTVLSLTTENNRSVHSDEGAAIHDPRISASALGLAALRTVLQHSSFYKEMVVLITNSYCEEHIPLLAIRLLNQEFIKPDSVSMLLTSHFGLDRVVMDDTLQNTGVPVVERVGNMTQHQQDDTGSHQSLLGGLSSCSSDAEQCESRIFFVTTPSLIRIVCLLLRNLLLQDPDTVGPELVQHQLIHHLFRCLKTFQFFSTSQHSTPNFREEKLLLYSAIVRLLEPCLLNKEIRHNLILQPHTLLAVTNLLSNCSLTTYSKTDAVTSLYIAVFQVVTSLLHIEGVLAMPLISFCLAQGWKEISEQVNTCIKQNNYPKLRSKALEFLNHLCFFETKRIETLPSQESLDHDPFIGGPFATFTALLDKQQQDLTDNKNDFQGKEEPGGQFGITIMSLPMKSIHYIFKSEKESWSSLVSNTLCSLLGVSESARSAVLDKGLVKIMLNDLKDTVNFISCAKQGNNSKCQELIQFFIEKLHVLQHLIYQSKSAKLKCELGIITYLRKIWSLCLTNFNLMSSCLSFLVTYTAFCAEACRSMVIEITQGSIGTTFGKMTILHQVVFVTEREINRFSKTRNSAVLKLSFQVLTNVCCISECRNIIARTNVLEKFTKLHPKQRHRGTHVQLLETLWFTFLIRLTTVSEGQQLLITIPGFINLLIDFATSGSSDARKNSVLILRNLCFQSTNKSHLKAYERIIPLFFNCLNDESELLPLYAASGLWALLANHQRVRPLAKSTEWSELKFQEIVCFMEEKGTEKSHQTAMYLNNVMKLLAEGD
ncbi:LOW QUALITY PROTEIN: rotatin homolog anastral spindle 3 [Tachypleus tridentatus]|uniref:LOW QUALITY PROTEIN: rotatin homolog anastral spindle 3 n=1 Tax=Tachypleus tridentatus TaxID=6853 RepID=UPI003FD07337